MILILSEREDAHVPYVTPRLEALRAEYLWFDPAYFPADAEIRVAYDAGGTVQRVLRYRGQEVDLATVTAVWFRRPGVPQAAPGVREAGHRRWVSEVSSHLLMGVWDALTCRWVPGRPRDLEAAEDKANQLALAARLGFRIPRTLITNRPQDFLAFYTECGGRLVTKVPRQATVRRDGERYGTLTYVVRRRDAARCAAIHYAPVILQEYVPKQVELRLTVVGSRVFAAEIHSQESRGTRDDWRHVDSEHIRHMPHALPAAVERLCVRLVQALHLCFGAIDVVLTPEGEYVFLEINPNGQWGWIEDLTDLRIGDAMADLLAHDDVASAKGG